jgi:hypothetical protein
MSKQYQKPAGTGQRVHNRLPLTARRIYRRRSLEGFDGKRGLNKAASLSNLPPFERGRKWRSATHKQPSAAHWALDTPWNAAARKMALRMRATIRRLPGFMRSSSRRSNIRKMGSPRCCVLRSWVSLLVLNGLIGSDIGKLEAYERILIAVFTHNQLRFLRLLRLLAFASIVV